MQIKNCTFVIFKPQKLFVENDYRVYKLIKKLEKTGSGYYEY